jgi:hypothetical protein
VPSVRIPAGLDVLECERCGGRLRILASIHLPNTKKVLPAQEKCEAE